MIKEIEILAVIKHRKNKEKYLIANYESMAQS